jgi:hypothetical protein
METINKSTIAIQVITNLSKALSKSPTGVSFVSIKGYTNSFGEVSNNLVNVGASLTNAKAKDITTLQSLDVTTLNGDSILLEKARVELINSFINPNENRSQGQIDAYTIVAKGIKVHNITGKIYGIYFMAGFPWSGVMLMLYKEVKKLVATAKTVNMERWLPRPGKLNPHVNTAS